MFVHLVLLFAAALTVTPVPQDSASWQKRLEKKAALVRAGGASVVFLGDEYTHFLEESWGGKNVWMRYWAEEPYRALNLGFAGDGVEHLLWRITKGGELDGYEAKAVVLAVGVNNFGRRGDPVGDVVSGIRRVLQEIRARQPKARTVLCAIFPRDGNPKWTCCGQLEKVNREIRKFADGRAVIWCDFTDLYVNLGLAEGAFAWTSAVMPQVNAILRGDGLPIAPRCRIRPRDIAGDNANPSSVRPVSRIMEGSWRGENWWGDRFARNRDFIADHRTKIDFVFAGSSSVHFWETAGAREFAALTNRYVILNCGYGGDRTQNLLWRFENGELDGYRAKGVVLSIGSNNNGVNGAKVTDTVAGIRACLDVIARKQPQAKVVLLAYQPRAVGTKDGDPAKDNGADLRNRETSAAMERMADGNRIIYVDVYDRFLVDGRLPKALSDDYLHPTEKGYGIIRAALEPVLEEIMRGK